MIVLVCGGRHYRYGSHVRHVLTNLHALHGPITLLVEGGASGADAAARVWAKAKGIGRTYEADWDKHKRAAGPIRNAIMLAEANPDLVLAFPGNTGTADMLAKARAAAVTCVVWEEPPPWCLKGVPCPCMCGEQGEGEPLGATAAPDAATEEGA